MPNARALVIATRNGVADPGQESVISELKRRLAEPDARLIVHLHGGLVDEMNGREIATRLSGRSERSWNLDDQWTQLYIVWRTGAIGTLKTNWTDLVTNDRLYQAVLSKLLRFVARNIELPVSDGAGARSAGEFFGLNEGEVLRRITGTGEAKHRLNPFEDLETELKVRAHDGARAGFRGGTSLAAQVEAFRIELDGDASFRRAIEQLAAGGGTDAGARGSSSIKDAAAGQKSFERLSEVVRKEILKDPVSGRKGERGIEPLSFTLLKRSTATAFRVFKRFRDQRDHGFHATVVEEVCREFYGDLVGAMIWGMIKRDAAEHFSGAGFGAALLEILKGVVPPRRVVVTAHSAGAIWACHLLSNMKAANLGTKLALFLLAPAVTNTLFADTIEKAGDLLADCRMFTMTDEHERKDPVLGSDLGFIYPSSLLYCVSGMFEENGAEPYMDAPLLGMRRFAGASFLNSVEKVAERKISKLLDEVSARVVLSPSPKICEATCHGCFDDEPATLATVAKLF